MLKENDFVKVHLYGCSNKKSKWGTITRFSGYIVKMAF